MRLYHYMRCCIVYDNKADDFIQRPWDHRAAQQRCVGLESQWTAFDFGVMTERFAGG